jgi:hypothetical protein
MSRTAKFDDKIGTFETLSLTRWLDDGRPGNLGIQLDISYWRHTTVFVVPDSDEPPPFTSAKQERVALFLNIMGRSTLHLPGHISFVPDRSYLFGGLGGGPIFMNIQYGFQGWGVGCQLLGGISFPLSRNLDLKIEGRYILAPDADTQPQKGWRIDTSGTPMPLRLSPHLDTRFTGILTGLYWKFPRSN